MKICAVTMVHRDYWALAQWMRHYSKHVGLENLYVVSHGYDAAIAEIAEGANIWTIPREGLEWFDRRRRIMLNHFQAGLLQYYDWVIRTDTDELICLDPEEYGSFDALLGQTEDDVVFGLGLNLFERASDKAIPDGASALRHRSAAIVTGHYSKAFAVSTNARLVRHGVRVSRGGVVQHSYAFPKGVYLVHLKFASQLILDEVNVVRNEMGNMNLPGMPGWSWKNADAQTKTFFERTEQLDFTPWEEAVSSARTHFLDYMRQNADDEIVRAPSIPFFCKTNLPDWFRDY